MLVSPVNEYDGADTVPNGKRKGKVDVNEVVDNVSLVVLFVPKMIVPTVPDTTVPVKIDILPLFPDVDPPLPDKTDNDPPPPDVPPGPLCSTNAPPAPEVFPVPRTILRAVPAVAAVVAVGVKIKTDDVLTVPQDISPPTNNFLAIAAPPAVVNVPPNVVLDAFKVLFIPIPPTSFKEPVVALPELVVSEEIIGNAKFVFPDPSIFTLATPAVEKSILSTAELNIPLLVVDEKLNAGFIAVPAAVL